MASEGKSANQEVVMVDFVNEGEVTEADLRVQDAPAAAAPAEGEVTLVLKFVSVDPYMRGRMANRKSYIPPFVPGKAMAGGCVAEVSAVGDGAPFAVGDLVSGFIGWVQEQTVKAAGLNKVDPRLVESGRTSVALGAAGMPGLSALLPLKNIAEPKEGEVAYVSGAAGAVGQVVGQVLKNLGLRVIGSAGSDEKVALLKELGFDEAFNYKTTDIETAVKEFAPEGINVAWDNVGGKTLEAILEAAAPGGRVVLCGAISQYNLKADERYGIKNLFMAVGKRLRLQGFIVTQYAAQFGEGSKELTDWFVEGKLRAEETVVEGFESIPSAFVGLFTGKNTGKMVVKV